MAPAGPGGRPKNAWNPSRQRKLVRLYTLTTLTKEEIQKVLGAPGFNPSSSDIQKKLRALFPPDYAKDHRKYRPLNDTNMKLRLDHLRRCKRGRISKEKRLRSSIMSRVHPKSIAFHESFANAFRDYTNLSSYDIPIVLSHDLTDSEPVASSLLLLDGSSINPASDHIGSGITRNTSTDDSSGKSSCDVQTKIDISAQPTRHSYSTQLEISGKRASSILRLGKQLADKFSEPYLKRINSIMRYSSSDSWRSSVASFSSRGSSLVSKQSAHNKIFALSSENDFQPKELELWNELVVEEKLRSDPIPQYHTVSLLNRKCCATFYRYECEQCGSRPYHRIVRSSILGEKHPSLNQLDFYGNNPLHCAAAFVAENDFRKIRQMLWPGVHLFQCNTFGETFLHILCRNGPKTSLDKEQFFLILGDLQRAEFPFSKRDYHGRTILHIFFQTSNGHQYSIPFLQQLFHILKPNLRVKDNAGFCVHEYLEELKDRESNSELSALVEQHCRLSELPLSYNFHPTLFSAPHERDFYHWLEENTRSYSITAINDFGDSTLIAMLKYWDQRVARRQFSDRLLRSSS